MKLRMRKPLAWRSYSSPSRIPFLKTSERRDSFLQGLALLHPSLPLSAAVAYGEVMSAGDQALEQSIRSGIVCSGICRRRFQAAATLTVPYSRLEVSSILGSSFPADPYDHAQPGLRRRRTGCGSGGSCPLDRQQCLCLSCDCGHVSQGSDGASPSAIPPGCGLHVVGIKCR